MRAWNHYSGNAFIKLNINDSETLPSQVEKSDSAVFTYEKYIWNFAKKQAA